jgi:hypothetical protein
MNLSYTPRRFVPLPPAVLPPPGQPTTDPIMPGDLDVVSIGGKSMVDGW